MNENEILALIECSEDLGVRDKRREAVEMLSNALLQQRDDRLYFERGRHYLFLDCPEQAIDDFTSAIELHPTNAKYYYWRGAVCWDDFEHQEFGDQGFLNGLSDLLTCARLDPTEAAPHIKVAECLLDRQLPDDALSFADIACELNPKSDGPHSVRGRCLKRLLRIDEAIEEYRVALNFSPNRSRTLSLLGRCYLALGDEESLVKANDCFHQAMELEPDSLWYAWDVYQFGESLLTLKCYQQAIEAMQRELDSSPSENTRRFAEIILRKAEKYLREQN